MDAFAWIGAASGLVGIVSVVASWIAVRKRAQPISVHTYAHLSEDDEQLLVRITNHSQQVLTINAAGYRFGPPVHGYELPILLVEQDEETVKGGIEGVIMGPGQILTGLVQKDFVPEHWEDDGELYQEFMQLYRLTKWGRVEIDTSVSGRTSVSRRAEVIDLDHWPPTLTTPQKRQRRARTS